jgi:hypothetical protein
VSKGQIQDRELGCLQGLSQESRVSGSIAQTIERERGVGSNADGACLRRETSTQMHQVLKVKYIGNNARIDAVTPCK